MTANEVFITRGIRAPEDIINSENTDYVMSQIRKRFLADSTVTIVLIGRCTWARKFVDWEIQSSLRQPAIGLPNGLMGILLDRSANTGNAPERLKLNLESGYAKWYKYPSSAGGLSQCIDEAFNARTILATRIRNPRDRVTYNRSCG